MNAVDAIYVMVGYKMDEASVKRVEAHFERMQALAGGAAKEASKAAQGVKAYSRDATKAAQGAQEATKAASAGADQFGASMTGALGMIKKAWPLLLTAAGGAIINSVFSEYKRGAEEVLGLALATNTGVEAFSELAYVAKVTGVPVDDLRDGLNDLSEKANEAYTALKEGKNDNEYLKTFKELGINVKEFVALSPDKRFQRFADAINTVQDAGKRSTYVMKLMSDEGTKFNAIFGLGSSGIQEFRDEAQQLGVVMKKDAADGLIRYNTALARFEARTSSLKQRLGEELLPALSDALEELLKAASPQDIKDMGDGIADAVKMAHKFILPVIKDTVTWIKELRTLIKELGGLGNVLKLVAIGIIALKFPAMIASLGAGAAGVIGMGKALIGLTFSLGGASAGMGVLTGAIKAAGLAAAKTTAKFFAIALPLLILEDYAVWDAGGDSVIGAIFGAKTQDNIDNVQNSLMGVAAILVLIAGLVFGLPAALALAIGAVAAFGYSARQDFDDFFTGVFGLLGIYTTKFLNGMLDILRAIFVDLPASFGNFLNDKLSFIGTIGGSVPMPAASPASDASRIGGTSINSAQSVNINVDARGQQDPAAVGAAAVAGGEDAARQLNNHYDNRMM